MIPSEAVAIGTLDSSQLVTDAIMRISQVVQQCHGVRLPETAPAASIRQGPVQSLGEL